jgi:hypothetical protein
LNPSESTVFLVGKEIDKNSPVKFQVINGKNRNLTAANNILNQKAPVLDFVNKEGKEFKQGSPNPAAPV